MKKKETDQKNRVMWQNKRQFQKNNQTCNLKCLILF